MMNTQSNSTRWWDLPAASLLMVALLTAASRLVVTRWTDELSIIQNLAILGGIVGLALGQSKFSPALASLFGFVYTLFVVPWQVGSIIKIDLPWPDRLLIVDSRINVILKQVSQRQPVTDSILFVAIMAVLFWLLSLQAGYFLTRHNNAWAAIIPCGVALLAINHYDMAPGNGRALYLVIYLFFALVLVARATFLKMRNTWQQTHTYLPPQLGADFISRSLVITGIIIGLVWVTPTLANSLPAIENATQPLQNAWQRFRDNASNWVAPLKGSGGSSPDYYGSNMTLGRGSVLTDDPVFQVFLPKDLVPDGVRFYWRANVYDTYTNGKWTNTIGSDNVFQSGNTSLNFPSENNRWNAAFEFVLSLRTGTLFSPPQPVWASQSGTVTYATNTDGTVDLFSFRAIPSLRPGQYYQVRASLSNATIVDLRDSSSDYPSWIRQRYLLLPSTITPRTRQLARDLTAGLSNPYDKTMAITNYLRDNIVYANVIPDLPANQEPIDWFLFDLKQGFCNYYASAEVIMLRSIGIPARWSVGYAQGILQPDGKSYQVLQRDSHAWPEVYFAGSGWVEFEPTAAQPVLMRPAARSTQAQNNSASTNSTNPYPGQYDQYLDELMKRNRGGGSNTPLVPTSQNPLKWLLLGGLILALMALIVLVIRIARRRNYFQTLPIRVEATIVRMGFRPPRSIQLWSLRASLSPLTRSYLEINSGLSRLGHRPAMTDTPFERAENLGQLVPLAAPPAQRLVEEYHLATFSPQPGDWMAARQAGSAVRKLTYQAWFRRLFSRFHLPSRGNSKSNE